MVETHLVAKVLVVNPKGEVLTLRRSKTDIRRPGEGDIPGGWVDEGEDLVTAAVRETQEEAGIQLMPPDLHLVYAGTAMRDGKNVCWLFFIGRTSETEVKLSFEHDKFEWLPLDKAIEAIPYKTQNDFLLYVRDNNLL
jgi:8-oxo-dGTP pyrophosphatase MutT (NUDIX family)